MVCSGLPGWYALVSNVANVLEPLAAALLLRQFVSLPPRFMQLREVGVVRHLRRNWVRHWCYVGRNVEGSCGQRFLAGV